MALWIYSKLFPSLRRYSLPCGQPTLLFWLGAVGNYKYFVDFFITTYQKYTKHGLEPSTLSQQPSVILNNTLSINWECIFSA